MTDMDTAIRKHVDRRNRGAALLVVLFVVMAVTIVSLGFLSRSDAELASGRNMLTRVQMDYLADSALEHAKGLMLHPQDVSGDYWTGASAQQLVSGSDEYYDVAVARDNTDPADRCTFNISCTAYRLVAGDVYGRQTVSAMLRLDPCIAVFITGDTTLSSDVTVNGDIYAAGTLISYAYINGDAFAFKHKHYGSVEGQEFPMSRASGITSPALNALNYAQTYAPDANGLVELVDETLTFNTSFVVDGDLTMDGGNITVNAPKNEPAFLISGMLTLRNNATLTVNGYAQTGGNIVVESGSGLSIYGALFITTAATINDSGSVVITADPVKAAMRIGAGSTTDWSPALGGFYKQIETN